MRPGPLSAALQVSPVADGRLSSQAIDRCTVRHQCVREKGGKYQLLISGCIEQQRNVISYGRRLLRLPVLIHQFNIYHERTVFANTCQTPTHQTHKKKIDTVRKAITSDDP